MFEEIVSWADRLDLVGLTVEADLLDGLLKRADKDDPILRFMGGELEVKVLVNEFGSFSPGKSKIFTNGDAAFAYGRTETGDGKIVRVLFRWEKRLALPDLEKVQLNPRSKEFGEAGGTWAEVGWKSENGGVFAKSLEKFGFYDALGNAGRADV